MILIFKVALVCRTWFEFAIETRQIVVEEIRKEQHIEKALNEEGNIEDVDTDDELNEAEEYEAWKNREIARIKRDREERDARLKEKEEIEKVRNMTEEERREWERKNPKPLRQTTKQKWKFMQKYYHKGAFFQEGADDVIQSAGKDDIYRRWIRASCPRSCKLNISGAVAEQNGHILLMRTLQIGMHRSPMEAP
ncbi:uncharacterized protein [Miscanthus floridulus]|uniref:uncharacterized protein n=1 Tax=Miscanthus floridulus TaxID=154761 RepID=UPI0034574B82